MNTKQKIAKLNRVAKRWRFRTSMKKGTLTITMTDRVRAVSILIAPFGDTIKATVISFGGMACRDYESEPLRGEELRKEIRKHGRRVEFKKRRIETLIALLDYVTE